MMQAYLRIVNSTKGTLLASRAEIADCFRKRLVGLLGRRALDPGCALWLFPSNAIHTIGMRFPIDVVMLSRNATVVKVCAGVRPYSVRLAKFSGAKRLGASRECNRQKQHSRGRPPED